MSESGMRGTLVKALRSLDAKPIENHMRAGTPDVNFRGGWIECKYLPAWPKNAHVSPVRLVHPLTKEQKIWITRRINHGGTALVCLKVGREWFFYDGLIAAAHVNESTRSEHIKNAFLHFTKGLDSRELIKWLTINSKG